MQRTGRQPCHAGTESSSWFLARRFASCPEPWFGSIRGIYTHKGLLGDTPQVVLDVQWHGGGGGVNVDEYVKGVTFCAEASANVLGQRYWPAELVAPVRVRAMPHPMD